MQPSDSSLAPNKEFVVRVSNFHHAFIQRVHGVVNTPLFTCRCITITLLVLIISSHLPVNHRPVNRLVFWVLENCTAEKVFVFEGWKLTQFVTDFELCFIIVKGY